MLPLQIPRLFRLIALFGLAAIDSVGAARGGDARSEGESEWAWEGEVFPVAETNAGAKTGPSQEEAADWRKTVEWLTVLQASEGARLTLIDSILEPTAGQRIVIDAQLSRAMDNLPRLNGGVVFADARVLLGELRALVDEHAEMERLQAELEKKHRLVAENEEKGRELGRVLNMLFEGHLLAGEPSPEARKKWRGIDEAYRLQGLQGVLRMSEEARAVGAFRTRQIDRQASAYYFLTRYHASLGTLRPEQARALLPGPEAESYTRWSHARERAEEIRREVSRKRMFLFGRLDALFAQRRFTEFVTAYRCMAGVLPPSMQVVVSEHRELGRKFTDGYARREGLVRLIPAHTARLLELAARYRTAGESGSEARVFREAAWLNEFLWHIPL